jgi:hypothetical protein
MLLSRHDVTAVDTPQRTVVWNEERGVFVLVPYPHLSIRQASESARGGEGQLQTWSKHRRVDPSADVRRAVGITSSCKFKLHNSPQSHHVHNPSSNSKFKPMKKILSVSELAREGSGRG